MKLSKLAIRTASIFAGCLLALSFGLGLYVYYLRTSLRAELTSYLTEVAKQSVRILQTQIQGDISSLLSTSAAISAYSDGNPHNQPGMPLLKETQQHNDFARMGFALPNGLSYLSDGSLIDIASRDYFKKALAGQNTVSDPLPDATPEGQAILLAVPVFYGNTVNGVLFAAHPVELYRNLIATDSFNGEGYSLIIKSNGDKVAFSPSAYADKTDSNIFRSPRNANLDLDGQMHNDIQAGKNGTTRFFRPDQGWLYLSYEPVGINDWYLLSVVPDAVAAKKTKTLIWLSLILCATGVLVFMALLSYIYLQYKQTRKILYQAAYIDPLLHQPNWTKTRQKITQLLADKPEQLYAFVAFDINRFQGIVERLGEGNANELLQYIATLLKEELKEGETSCRVHEDIFQLLLIYDSPEQLKNRLELLNEKIVSWTPSHTSRFQFIISFGAYLIQDRTLSATDMLTRALIARNTVKGNYNRIIAFYDEEMHQRIRQSQTMESRMEQAVLKREFTLRLLPILNVDNCQVIAQAQLTWHTSDKQEIPEEIFRPLFIKNGFISRLDIYMIEEVCRSLKAWHEQHKKTVPLAVEISADSLRSPYFLTVLRKMIRQYDIHPAELILQLTPLTSPDDLPLLNSLIQPLQKEGFLLGLNHFGRGNISLDLIKTLPISCITIENDFFRDITENKKTQAIIASFIGMAKALHVRILFDRANPAQWQILHKLGAQLYSQAENSTPEINK